MKLFIIHGRGVYIVIRRLSVLCS